MLAVNYKMKSIEGRKIDKAIEKIAKESWVLKYYKDDKGFLYVEYYNNLGKLELIDGRFVEKSIDKSIIKSLEPIAENRYEAAKIEFELEYIKANLKSRIDIMQKSLNNFKSEISNSIIEEIIVLSKEYNDKLINYNQICDKMLKF